MDVAVAHELPMLRDTVRRFVQQELIPLEREYADAPDIPDALRAELQDKPRRWE